MYKIFYTKKFVNQFERLPKDIQSLTYKKIEIFKQNNKDISLKTHKLKGELLGYFSFSISYDIRIVFEYGKNKDIFFLKIGNHDIYR